MEEKNKILEENSLVKMVNKYNRAHLNVRPILRYWPDCILSSAGGSLLRMAAIYTGGRPSVLFNTAGTPLSTSQTMLHAVQEGPSGVYEVKASTIADVFIWMNMVGEWNCI